MSQKSFNPTLLYYDVASHKRFVNVIKVTKRNKKVKKIKKSKVLYIFIFL